MMEFPLEAIIVQVFLWAITGGLGWVVGRMGKYAKEDKEEREALHDGMRCLLRAELVEKHKRYVVDGEPMRYYDRQNLEHIHKAYKSLHGNGLGDRLWHEIEQKELSSDN